MSQEEEKLIEEKLIKELSEEFVFDSEYNEIYNFEQNIPLILKAYRAGKLAGFEISKEKVKNELGCDGCCSLAVAPDEADEFFRPLIEEEKKKL